MKNKKHYKNIPKKLPLAIALAINSLCVTAQFNPIEELSGLNGNNGFVMNGVAENDHTGRSVSAAGDMNGDGVNDIIIGSEEINANGSRSGASYVVFGSSSGFNSSLNLSSLNGNNGFIINGVAELDFSSDSIRMAGDINGDDLDDLIIGAHGVDTNGDNSGASYVVFGSDSGFNASLNLSSLNGSNGFVINGIATGDSSGKSVSGAGDINGDGIDDIIIGAEEVNTNGDYSGASYVVFGSNLEFNASVNLSNLNGTNGFVINGVAEYDYSGNSVSTAGDVNGDGFDDIIIGANRVNTNGARSGASYVVFGSNSEFNSPLELSTLNGNNGFVINGVSTDDFSGGSVSAAGDVNGDGVDDLIIGASSVDTNGDKSGASYVVFGSNSGFNASLNLSALNGSNGFVINGVTTGDRSGGSVSTAGDVNGDGLNDVIIGATSVSTNGDRSGATYVVFGSRTGFNASLSLSSLNGSNGFVMNGVTTSDNSGVSVSTAGDVNSDGLDDLIIGASSVATNGFRSGAGYVVFGNDVIFSDGFE